MNDIMQANIVVPPAPPPKEEPSKEMRRQEVKRAIEAKPRTKVKHEPYKDPQSVKHETKSGNVPAVSLIDGVHIELYKYFNLSPSMVERGQIEKLKRVFDWASKGEDNIGRALAKVQSLENRLGRNIAEVDRLTRMNNHLRIRELSK